MICKSNLYVFFCSSYSFCGSIIQECVSFMKASLSLGLLNHSVKGVGHGSILIEGNLYLNSVCGIKF